VWQLRILGTGRRLNYSHWFRVFTVWNTTDILCFIFFSEETWFLLSGHEVARTAGYWLMKAVMFSWPPLPPKIRGVSRGFTWSSVLNTLLQGHSWGKLKLGFNTSILCYSNNTLRGWFQQDFSRLTFESGCSWISHSSIPWQGFQIGFT